MQSYSCLLCREGNVENDHREGVEGFNGDTSYYVSTKEYYTAPKNIQLFKIHYFEHAGLVELTD